MTQEEKETLLKDICPRLPYNLSVEVEGVEATPLGCNKVIHINTRGNWVYISGIPTEIEIELIKPYLRSIPNLTEEERIQLGRLLGAASYKILKGDYFYLKELLEYVYKNHIDLFGLIPNGLAIEAPKELYKS